MTKLWLLFPYNFTLVIFAQFFLTYSCYLLDIYTFSFVFTNNELVIDFSLLGRIDLSHFLSLEWSVTSGSNSSCYNTLSQLSFGVYVHQTHHYILCQKNDFDWLCKFLCESGINVFSKLTDTLISDKKNFWWCSFYIPAFNSNIIHVGHLY